LVFLPGFPGLIIADSDPDYGIYGWLGTGIESEIGPPKMANPMHVLLLIFVFLDICLAALLLRRWLDKRQATVLWQTLAASHGLPASRFHPALVASLPEPARRYFLFTIQSGALIQAVSKISAIGQIGLGTKDKPNYQPMTTEQILAPPLGLVWKLRAGKGLLRISGSDAFSGDNSWTRFWLLGVIPIVRVGGNADHLRAAYGRVIAEAVFWAPATLLPSASVVWEAPDANTARATVTLGKMIQTVDITVAADGRPTTVTIPRWSNANSAKTYRLQPFGGYLSEFREFDGYRLPTLVEGGNFIGTDDYFPFYKVTVTGLRFCSGP
jgi:hypothetical protein